MNGILVLNKLLVNGGPGSGNFGHCGRPGERGGSSDDCSGPLIKPKVEKSKTKNEEEEEKKGQTQKQVRSKFQPGSKTQNWKYGSGLTEGPATVRGLKVFYVDEETGKESAMDLDIVHSPEFPEEHVKISSISLAKVLNDTPDTFLNKLKKVKTVTFYGTNDDFVKAQ